MKNISLLNYLNRILKWFVLGKYHLLTIFVVIITIGYLIGMVSFYPIYISSIFSITGLTIILFQQLLDARQYSDHKPNTFKNWISSFPSIKPRVANLSANMSTSISVKAHLSVSISENASLENKVAHLLREVESLDKRMITITDNLEKTNKELLNKSKELAGNIEKVSSVLKSLIAGHIVGSYDINFFGIIITICGTLIQLFKGTTP